MGSEPQPKCLMQPTGAPKKESWPVQSQQVHLFPTARVHIANSSRNPFQKNAEPSASVSVTATDGAMPANHAKALRYLVASAVAGLSPDNVTVIDDKGGLIGTSDEVATSGAGQDKAEALRAKVQNLIEARVGYGNAVVEVSVDTITETESIRETLIDPESRVAISTDTEERSGNSTEAAGGDVTVASNLPDGAAGGGGDGNSSQNTETRERVNYEVSETLREVTRAAGAIKRLSVAVLVNGTEITNAEGQTVFEPRSAAELETLKELVSSAVGYDETRGDGHHAQVAPVSAARYSWNGCNIFLHEFNGFGCHVGSSKLVFSHLSLLFWVSSYCARS